MGNLFLESKINNHAIIYQLPTGDRARLIANT
jgi:hypothetical protein